MPLHLSPLRLFLTLLALIFCTEGAFAGGNDASRVAEKIITALSAPFSLSGGTREVRIGASIGIAIYPGNADEGDALLKAADAAMYDAKRSKNCFRFFAAIGAAG